MHTAAPAQDLVQFYGAALHNYHINQQARRINQQPAAAARRQAAGPGARPGGGAHGIRHRIEVGFGLPRAAGWARSAAQPPAPGFLDRPLTNKNYNLANYNLETRAAGGLTAKKLVRGGNSGRSLFSPAPRAPYIFLIGEPTASVWRAFGARRSRAFSKNSQGMDLSIVLNSGIINK
jgi:hypothetical protein